MSLENLLKIGQLKAHPPDAREIEQLLAAAHRNLCDARVTSISAETRFDVSLQSDHADMSGIQRLSQVDAIAVAGYFYYRAEAITTILRVTSKDPDERTYMSGATMHFSRTPHLDQWCRLADAWLNVLPSFKGLNHAET